MYIFFLCNLISFYFVFSSFSICFTCYVIIRIMWWPPIGWCYYIGEATPVLSVFESPDEDLHWSKHVGFFNDLAATIKTFKYFFLLLLFQIFWCAWIAFLFILFSPIYPEHLTHFWSTCHLFFLNSVVDSDNAAFDLSHPQHFPHPLRSTSRSTRWEIHFGG